MHITQFGHLAFNCRDLARSVRFYRETLGLKQTFSITYGDRLENLKRSGREIPPERAELFSKLRDRDWIVYMQIGDGAFVELFDADPQADCTVKAVPSNFAHVALMVEDIFAAEQALREKGVPVDVPPALGTDCTWQMWSRDPDGNRIEFMQYTLNSWQLIGKN